MDFFQRQEQAHHNTRRLVVYFAAGVVLLIAALYLVTVLAYTGVMLEDRPTHPTGRAILLEWWHPQLLLAVAGGTLAIISLGSLYKLSELSAGGPAVASMLGGSKVASHTPDPDERRLLNVVEEMSIASGVPMPEVYILREERGINAFAAGHSTADAVVAVTEGTLRLLSRDELQGVIGHEFSHILNGDMRLNLRLMGAIFGIMCLALIGRVLLEVRDSGDSRDSRNKNGLVPLGLALMALGWIGVIFGRLIQAAVSRQREYLADASSVQFTRNPAGLAGALKKIAVLSYGSRLESAHTQEASHMFFGNGMAAPWLDAMATHPPLLARIRAIEPSFDGRFPALKLPQPPPQPAPTSKPASRRTMPFPMPFPAEREDSGLPPIIPAPARPGLAAAGILAPMGSQPVHAQTVLSDLGTPTPAHLRYAEELRCAIPESLRLAAREPFEACTLIYALLLSAQKEVRARQLEELQSATSAGMCQETQRRVDSMQVLAVHAKLPLVDLTLPALRQLSPAQFGQFKQAVQLLVECDGEIDLFEYVLQKIVLRHLEPNFTEEHKQPVQFYSLKALVPDCAVLLSQLAYLGQSDPAQVQAAFQAGAQLLGGITGVTPELLAPEQCGLDKVDAVLTRFSQAGPQIKKNILEACVQTVAFDGVLQELEAELLRAIADTLDCPMPPMLAEGQLKS